MIPNLELPEVVNLNCKGTFTGHSGPVWGLAVTETGLLISASSDTTIKIWDVANFKCKQTLLGHEGIVHAVVVHGNLLCSGSSDKSIRIWDLSKNGECVKIIKFHDNTVCSLAVANGILFSGSYTEIKVWDLETFECIQTLTGHNHWVRALAVSGGRLYSGSYNIINVHKCYHKLVILTISAMGFEN
jgi:WD40 repeat protein